MAWICGWWGTGSGDVATVLVWAVGFSAVGAAALLCSGSRRLSTAVPAIGWACIVGCAVLVVTAGHGALRSGCGIDELAQSGARVQVVGVVASDPVPVQGFGGRGTRAHLVVEDVTYRGVQCQTAARIDVRGSSGWDSVAVGTRVATGGTVTEGIRGSELVVSTPVVVDAAGSVLSGVADIRTALLDATDGLSPQARGLVPGAAIGDTTRVPDAVADAMLATSLTHITAVSGGHVAVVVACVAWCCGLLRASRAVRIAVAALALVGFVLLVRPDPSVLRASATGAVGLVALGLRRPAAAIPALSAAVIVLLVMDPWLSRSFGFVLSTVATAGLVTMSAPIARRIPGPRVVAFALAVPIAAQLACGPVLILLQPSVPVYAVPANLIACLALAPATILGLAATVFAPWWPAVATIIAWCAGLATWWIATTAQVFAALPGASMTWPKGVLGAAGLSVLTVLGVEGLRRVLPGDDQMPAR